jgi:hypothetical protein
MRTISNTGIYYLSMTERTPALNTTAIMLRKAFLGPRVRTCLSRESRQQRRDAKAVHRKL